jgi:acetyl-CoA carboxylase biotin carboxyl carrier protein
MNAGQLQSLKDLIEFLKQQEVGEFELEQEGLKVRLSFAGQVGSANHIDLSQLSHLVKQSAPLPVAVSAAASTAHVPQGDAAATAAPNIASTGEETGLHIIRSPIVGTFYEASAPGSEPYIKVGDQIDSGQVVCIVEAMKLMNEIESDIAGEVMKRLVTSGQPVEYGQPLFAIRPR